MDWVTEPFVVNTTSTYISPAGSYWVVSQLSGGEYQANPPPSALAIRHSTEKNK
jgi:hypothetical protein